MRCFDRNGTVRESAAGDALASLATMLWNAPSKSWTVGATMADASHNRRMTVRLGDVVAFAQLGARIPGAGCGSMRPLSRRFSFSSRANVRSG